MIFTFYSYKGGVGRSMALATVARVLAGRGARVLAVDFDLEAPGLELYFFDRERALEPRAHLGVIDLLSDYRQALSSEAAFDKREFKDLRRYTQVARERVGQRGGRVDLMTAGARAAGEVERAYGQKVRAFDWQDFYYNWQGDRFFDWLRRQWSDAGGYDVVLVDSRTGVTEMGGVCAYQLADAAVLFCAANDQNLKGTLAVAQDFVSPGVLGLRNGRPLQILALVARLESQHPRREAFLDEFEQELGPLGLPKRLADQQIRLRDLALPYLPEFAIAEHQVGDYLDDRSLARPEYRVFEDLSDALTLMAPEGDRLARWRDEVLARRRGAAAPADEVPLQADTSQSSAGFDAFIDYGPDDAGAVEAMAQALTMAGWRVFYDRADLKAGSGWQEQLERAMTYSAHLLVCFGRSSSHAQRERVLDRARRLRGMRIVPVLLPGGEFSALRSFGLEALQVLDLRKGPEPRQLEAWVRGLRESAEQGRAPASPAEEASPYPGSRAYDEDDAAVFCGRDAERDQLLQSLTQEPVLLLEGPAQVGKTSLVQAGLLKAWRDAGNVVVGRADLSAGDAVPPGWPPPQAHGGRSGRSSAAALQLLLVDGIDSMPTLGAGQNLGDAVAQRVLRVAEVLRGRPESGRVLLVWRGAWGRDQREAAIERWGGRDRLPRQLLRALSGDALREAIEVPARRRGHLLESGLLERLVESAGDAACAIAQIQVTLAAMWPERRRGWLTHPSLDALGHLGGLFQQRLQRILSEWTEPEQRAALALWRALCQRDTAGAIVPRRMPWATLASLPALRAEGWPPEVLRDRLAGVALIDLIRETDAAEGPGPSDGVLVGLVRQNPQAYFADPSQGPDPAFLAWRAQAEAPVAEWAASPGRAGHLLPGGAALVEAENWLRRLGDELTDDERAFIAAAQRQGQAAREVAFVVPGSPGRKAVAGHLLASTAASVSTSVDAGTTSGRVQRVSAVAGEDIVLLTPSLGPPLFLHPHSAQELLQSQLDEDAGLEAALPPVLRWRRLEAALGPTAGVHAPDLGETALRRLDIVRAEQVDIDRLLADEGTAGARLYLLPEAPLAKALQATPASRLPVGTTKRPVLVLIHDAPGDVESSFGGLWQAPELVHALLTAHGGSVYALRWPALSGGPLEAIEALATALPAGAQLRVLAHGAGAWVAEGLLRLAQRPDDLPPAASDHLRRHVLGWGAKAPTVQRIVRVAAPMRGSHFGGPRLDAWLSIQVWALGDAGRRAPEWLTRLLVAAAERRLSARDLPGLAALAREGPLARWMNADAPPSTSELRCLAADADEVYRWFKTLVSDRAGRVAHDLAFGVDEMLDGGMPRAAPTWVWLGAGSEFHHHRFFDGRSGPQAVLAALLQDQPSGFVARTTLPERAGPNPKPGATEPATMAEPVATAAATAPAPVLRLRVLNADLAAVAGTVMVGHAQGPSLGPSEARLDELMQGALGRALETGIYPAQPGEHQLITSGAGTASEQVAAAPRRSALVVGLGPEGALRPTELAYGVRQAVMAWVLRQREEGTSTGPLRLFSAHLGAGAAGLDAALAAQQVAEGVAAANEQLVLQELPPVSEVVFVEPYHDLAGAVWRALREAAAAGDRRIEVGAGVDQGRGALRRRLAAVERAGQPDLLSVTAVAAPDGGHSLELLWRSGGEPVRAAVGASQCSMVQAMLEAIALKGGVPSDALQTVTQLLVPPDLQMRLARTAPVTLELDAASATLPWEWLTARGDAERQPWALRCRPVRRLRTTAFRSSIGGLTRGSDVLVLADAGSDGSPGGPADGIRAEALQLETLLRVARDLPIRVLGPSKTAPAQRAREALAALYERDWRVLHLSGVGADDGQPALQLADARIGPREIAAMRVVPELVVVHVRATGEPAVSPWRLAGQWAEGLLTTGVRCVLLTAGPVSAPAHAACLQDFYDALLKGHTFAEATARGRAAAWVRVPQDPSWAAYQAWGLADWRFARNGQARAPSDFADALPPLASAPELALVLEGLATQAELLALPDAPLHRPRRDRIEELERTYAARWGVIGAVAESFGVAWAAVGDPARASAWLQRAVQAEDGSASLQATWRLAQAMLDRAAGLRRPPTAQGGQVRATALDAARVEAEGARGWLRVVQAGTASPMRSLLLVRAGRELAMIERAAGRAVAERAALVQLAGEAQDALELWRARSGSERIELRLTAGIARWLLKGSRAAPGSAIEIDRGLQDTPVTEPDALCARWRVDAQVTQALIAGRLSRRRRELALDYATLRASVDSPAFWAAAHDQLAWAMSRSWSVRARASEQRAARELLQQLEGAATPSADPAAGLRP